MEDIAGEALGVHPDQDVFAVLDVASDERDVRLPVDLILEGA